jgi:hypothetical protein
MPRIYSVTFEQVAVSAAQDLVQITGASGKMCLIKSVEVYPTDTTLVTAQDWALRSRFLPATVTNGNGTSATPQKNDPGDAAASFTAIVNSTTKATTSGTAVTQREWGGHIFAGFAYTWPTGSEPTVGPSEAFVFELLSTVSGTVHLSGTVLVAEIGG